MKNKIKKYRVRPGSIADYALEFFGLSAFVAGMYVATLLCSILA